ncbi:hypothetical protein LAV78_20275 [Brucella intermedia]|nr:hypothetical protein [Brucella intermedia]MCB4920858.1 hypothetical protein [Brucella intermedia]
MIDRSKQTAMPTPSSAALRFKRSLRASACPLMLTVSRAEACTPRVFAI